MTQLIVGAIIALVSAATGYSVKRTGSDRQLAARVDALERGMYQLASRPPIPTPFFQQPPAAGVAAPRPQAPNPQGQWGQQPPVNSEMVEAMRAFAARAQAENRL